MRLVLRTSAIVSVIALSFWLCPISWASDLSPEYANRIVDAIGKTEHSVKYPFGIKSIDTHGDAVYARRICLNSVRNAWKRWQTAGKPGDFIRFMGVRYSPPARNPNWVPLVHFFLEAA